MGSLKKKLTNTVSKAKAKVLGTSAIAAEKKEEISNEDKKDDEETRKDDEEKESLEVDSTKIEQKEALKNGSDVPEKYKSKLTEEEKKEKKFPKKEEVKKIL